MRPKAQPFGLRRHLPATRTATTDDDGLFDIHPARVRAIGRLASLCLGHIPPLRASFVIAGRRSSVLACKAVAAGGLSNCRKRPEA